MTAISTPTPTEVGHPGVPAHRARGPRLALGLVVLLGVLVLICLASMMFGSRSISLETAMHALGHPDATDQDTVIVRSLRIPRTAVGLLAGLALGLAGTVMQGITRNPLADPGLLGVNAGASLSVVTAIAYLGATSLDDYVWYAFIGAAVAAAVVYAVGSMGPRGATPTSLALAGAALTALLGGITTLILLQNVNAFDQFRFWTVGSVVGRGADVVMQVAPFIGAGIVVALCLGRLLNVMSMGDDIARSLGQNVAVAQGLSGLAVVILCGAATAAAGPIVFVGLAVPHVARLITGPDYRWILPYSMVLAPILLIGADILGRLIAPPAELQVGVMTALIGAPIFILLVRRQKMAEL